MRVDWLFEPGGEHISLLTRVRFSHLDGPFQLVTSRLIG